MRYLKAYIWSSPDHYGARYAAKRGFYCAANCIIGKVERVPSEEVIIQQVYADTNV